MNDFEKSKASIRNRKIFYLWLYIPLAIISSTILGVTVGLLGMSIGPDNRSLSLGLINITFPIISGIALIYCLGNKRPWAALFVNICAGSLIGLVAWMLNNWRWA